MDKAKLDEIENWHPLSGFTQTLEFFPNTLKLPTPERTNSIEPVYLVLLTRGDNGLEYDLASYSDGVWHFTKEGLVAYWAELGPRLLSKAITA